MQKTQIYPKKERLIVNYHYFIEFFEGKKYENFQMDIILIDCDTCFS